MNVLASALVIKSAITLRDPLSAVVMMVSYCKTLH